MMMTWTYRLGYLVDKTSLLREDCRVLGEEIRVGQLICTVVFTTTWFTVLRIDKEWI